MIRWGIVFSLGLFSVGTGAVTECTKIGILGEFSRATSRTAQPFGLQIQRGLTLAFAQIGRSQARPCIAYQIFDIGNTVANVPDTIQRASKEGVSLFLGLGTSDQVLAAIPALNQTQSLLITPTASSDDFVEKNGRVVLIFPRNSLIAASLAKDAYRRGVRKVLTVFASNSKYSSDIAQQFRASFTRLGGEIVKELPIRSGRVDLEDNLSVLKSLAYTHVFLPIFELDVAKSIAFFEARGLKKVFIGADSWGTYSDVIKGLVGTTPFTALMPVIYSSDLAVAKNQAFAREFTRAYGAPPTDLAAFSYEGILLYQKLLKACGQSNLLKQAGLCLDKVLPLDGLTGRVTSREFLSLDRPVRVTTWTHSRKAP